LEKIEWACEVGTGLMCEIIGEGSEETEMICVPNLLKQWRIYSS
jgi:hypothetical protein